MQALNCFVQCVERALAVAKECHWRQLIWLSGERTWCLKQVRALTCQIDFTHSAFVAEDVPEPSLCTTHIKTKHCHRYLGAQFECLVYDGYSGVNPDSLAQISGTLAGGGVLILITPERERWDENWDSELKSLTVEPLGIDDVGRHFLERFYRALSQEKARVHFGQRTGITPASVAVGELIPQCDVLAEQAHCLQAMLGLITTQRTSNAVLSADRGRGKSALLGLLAKQVTPSLPVFLTAPGGDSVTTALAFAEGALDFYTSDALLRELANLPRRALLLVDEAAAISADQLAMLMTHFDHCVFSTTLYGYEGTGQGFNLRFTPRLQRYDPATKFFHLQAPIRWGAHDPVERWLNSFLLLRPTNEQAISLRSSAPALRRGGIDIARVNREQLAADEVLLAQVFALLVQAHYRTTPSDLRILLDSPNILLWLAKQGSVLVGVCLVATEGPIEHSLAAAIWRGERRPRGHLLPQILLGQEGYLDAAQLCCLRVVRIATAESARRRGVAAALLEAISEYARRGHIHYIGANFALSSPLIQFWRASGFIPARVGSALDPVSGSFNVLVIKPLVHCKPLEQFIRSFARRLGFQQKYFFDPTHWGGDQLVGLCEETDPEQLDTQWACQQVAAFASAHRAFESVAYLLAYLLERCVLSLQHPALEEQHRRLFEAYFIHQIPIEQLLLTHKLSGYREFVRAARAASRALLNVHELESH
ncbi:MAG: GNAT family N-acetyltransferase [Pseudomonadales bacterium]